MKKPNKKIIQELKEELKDYKSYDSLPCEKSCEPQPPEGNFLNGQEYFEWMTSLEQMNVANEKKRSAELEHELIKKDIQILNMKLELNKHIVVKSAYDKAEDVKKEYTRFLKELELKKGFVVRGKIIDPITFEVKDDPT